MILSGSGQVAAVVQARPPLEEIPMEVAPRAPRLGAVQRGERRSEHRPLVGVAGLVAVSVGAAGTSVADGATVGELVGACCTGGGVGSTSLPQAASASTRIKPRQDKRRKRASKLRFIVFPSQPGVAASGKLRTCCVLLMAIAARAPPVVAVH